MLSGRQFGQFSPLRLSFVSHTATKLSLNPFLPRGPNPSPYLLQFVPRRAGPRRAGPSAKP